MTNEKHYGTAEELNAASAWLRANLHLILGEEQGEEEFRQFPMREAWFMFLHAMSNAPEA